MRHIPEICFRSLQYHQDYKTLKNRPHRFLQLPSASYSPIFLSRTPFEVEEDTGSQIRTLPI